MVWIRSVTKLCLCEKEVWKTEQNVDLIWRTGWDANPASVKRTRDNYVTPQPHPQWLRFLFLFFFSFGFCLSPPPTPYTLPTFTLQNDLLHFTTADLKSVRVRNVSRSWEYTCSSQWIWGEAWNLFCLLLSHVVKYALPRWDESGDQWHVVSRV